MQKIRLAVRNLLLALTISAMSLIAPLGVYAQTAPEGDPGTSDPDSTVSTTTETEEPPPEEETPPADPPAEEETLSISPTPPPPPPALPGPAQPNGADAHTFFYMPDTNTWENDYFSWSPLTKLRTPKQPQYRYNKTAKSWEMTDWRYNPALQRYIPFAILISKPPQHLLISNTGAGSTNIIDSNGSGSGTIDGTGPGSSNTILLDSTGNTAIDLLFNGTITHNHNGSATSGDASVLQNTTAGGATSGDATSAANILNMLQSSWGAVGSGSLTTFLANIDGDVVGDLVLDPGQLTSQNLGVGSGTPTDLTINSETNGQITNNITLDATSGDATVAGNTNAGDATTGNAAAMANVVNMINSSIAAGQSFVGTININGNLEGDILLPDWLENQLLASASGSGATTPWLGAIDTTGPGSTNTINQDNSGSLDATFDDNFLINNDITATATSGDATVAGNTRAGGATTGNADTNVTLLNLTGRQVVGKNSILVFVNVLGEWVGLIVDAPAGSTAAALGNGITTNGLVAVPGQDVDINATTNSVINNNITATATSGDANVTGNTTAGGATTGNATASVNVLNIAGSQLSMTDWFGVLFINVLGTWHGSFGVDTAMGDRPIDEGKGAGSSSGGSGGVFQFRPKTLGSSATVTHVSNDSQNNISVGVTSSATTPPLVKTAEQGENAATTSLSNPQDIAAPNWLITLLIGGLASLLVLKSDWFLALFRLRSGGNPSV